MNLRISWLISEKEYNLVGLYLTKKQSLNSFGFFKTRPNFYNLSSVYIEEISIILFYELDINLDSSLLISLLISLLFTCSTISLSYILDSFWV